MTIDNFKRLHVPFLILWNTIFIITNYFVNVIIQKYFYIQYIIMTNNLESEIKYVPYKEVVKKGR